MSFQSVEERYPTAPEGFWLLREYDPGTGLNAFRVDFTARLTQVITDEMLASIDLTSEELWGTVIRELESSLKRRFR